MKRPILCEFADGEIGDSVHCRDVATHSVRGHGYVGPEELNACAKHAERERDNGARVDAWNGDDGEGS